MQVMKLKKDINLKERLKALGMTQQEFSVLCCVSLRTIQRWVERGYPSALAEYVLDVYEGYQV